MTAAPRSPIARAAALPTAPKPWMITRAPASSTTLASLRTSAHTARPKPVAPSSSSGTPPSAPGTPTARPISSYTYAIDVSVVPMSGPGMYSVSCSIARAKARMTRSWSGGARSGGAAMPDFPPPCGKPATAFFTVMALASRATSRAVMSGRMRTPPMAGPSATLSTTTTAS